MRNHGTPAIAKNEHGYRSSRAKWTVYFAVLFALSACPRSKQPEPSVDPGPSTPSEPAQQDSAPVAGNEPVPAPTPSPEPSKDPKPRTSAYPGNAPLYSRFEGTSFKNKCESDSQCFVGGCSQETCSAEEGLVSTCEAIADAAQLPKSKGAHCGCVENSCQWWVDQAAAPAPTEANPSKPTPPAKMGSPCSATGECPKGLSCITYFGIAGPQGPKFSSCEKRCKIDADCGEGQGCVTIADGPGRVCRPKS